MPRRQFFYGLTGNSPDHDRLAGLFRIHYIPDSSFLPLSWARCPRLHPPKLVKRHQHKHYHRHVYCENRDLSHPPQIHSSCPVLWVAGRESISAVSPEKAERTNAASFGYGPSCACLRSCSMRSGDGLSMFLEPTYTLTDFPSSRLLARQRAASANHSNWGSRTAFGRPYTT